MSNAFWKGGDKAYEAGIRQHYDAALRDLHTRRSECSDVRQRIEIQLEIERLEKELRNKIREIGSLLF